MSYLLRSMHRQPNHPEPENNKFDSVSFQHGFLPLFEFPLNIGVFFWLFRLYSGVTVNICPDFLDRDARLQGQYFGKFFFEPVAFRL